MKARGRAGGCVWVFAAVVLATAGSLFGNSRIIATWRVCVAQDHEPDPNAGATTLAVWVVMLTGLLVLGWVLGDLPNSRWYRLPVMVTAAVALTFLYVAGMGSPARLPPGEPPEKACATMPTFPFTG